MTPVCGFAVSGRRRGSALTGPLHRRHGDGGWLDPSAVLSGALGVAGGLLAYWLGQRSSAKREREYASLRAPGEMLAALGTLSLDPFCNSSRPSVTA